MKNTTKTNVATIDRRNAEALAKAIEDMKSGAWEQWPATFSPFGEGSKTGAVPAINRTPGTCGTCCRDCPGCYAKNNNFQRQNVVTANARRTAMSIVDPVRYWAAIRHEVTNPIRPLRYVRYFGSGDIGDAAYFAEMVKLAEDTPSTMYMAFTQYHDLVNRWIDEHGDLPSNLIIIFSTLGRATINNPHNLPVSVVVNPDDIPATLEKHPDWLTCGGSCEDCACRGLGCWRIRKGETLVLPRH